MGATCWMVRAGVGGKRVSDFVDGGYVAVSLDEELGPVPEGSSREWLIAKIRERYPGRKEAKNINVAGQLYRFHAEMRVGDEVVTYDGAERRYYLGRIESEVEHVPEAMPYRRRVKWTHRVDRDALAVATRNTLGSVLTLFCPNEEAAADIRAQAVPIDAPESETVVTPARRDAVEADMDDLRASMISQSHEFIEDLIAALEPDDMERLVAGILGAMGYKARVSPKGADRGIDVFASPDGLGLEEPRIFVEVKHRMGTKMGAQEVRAFMGGRQPGDRCLFVSTGGFAKDARYEADRSNVPLTLIDLPRLRELVLERYEDFDDETRRLLPLTRVYWPAVVDA